VLGFPLSAACWDEGERVNRTDVAQPGIFTTSVAVVRVLEERGLDRSAVPFTAGLSLGEYTALWCAGSLAFEDGVRLVRLRGEAMQAASESTKSGMVSLMGANEEQARAIAAEGASAGICQVANLNAPGQVIVSGELAALDVVEAKAKDHGVRRTRRLVVAGGFHSECMRPAGRAPRGGPAGGPDRGTAHPVREQRHRRADGGAGGDPPAARRAGLRACPVGAQHAPGPRARRPELPRARTRDGAGRDPREDRSGGPRAILRAAR
jgi:hypothetical protein